MILTAFLSEKKFDQIEYEGKKVSDYNYIAIGKVCIGKAYSGKGLLDKCYAKFNKAFEEKYDFEITEISISNHRYLQSHNRIGFKVIDTFHDGVEEWDIVIWDWRKKG